MFVYSDDLRDWFVKQETALFKYRFEQESLEEKKSFLRHLNLNWKIVRRTRDFFFPEQALRHFNSFQTRKRKRSERNWRFAQDFDKQQTRKLCKTM